MKKILVIGEHPANQSGFGRLNNYISTALDDSRKFDEVTSLGFLPRKVNPNITGVKYLTLNSPKYAQDETKYNMYGAISLSKFLAENTTYTDVLCIGDPWYYTSIADIKALFPHIIFHYYCPVEGESFMSHVYNTAQPDRHDVSIKDVLRSMDNVISYSNTGKRAINNMMMEPICKEHVFHWVSDTSSELVVVPAIQEHLGDKFVVGIIGRNCFRKAIDCMMLMANELAQMDNNIVILAHIPKKDSFGFDVECLYEQLLPKVRDIVVFTEDIIPGIFMKKVGNTIYRDIKNGADISMIEYLYRRMDIMINMSRAEGFGFPIAEAMVRGTPVMVNGYATPKELIELTGTQDICSVPPAGKEFYASGNNSLMGLPNVKEFARRLHNLSLTTNSSILIDIAKKQKHYARAELLDTASPSKQKLINMLSVDNNSRHKSTVTFITSHMKKCGIRTYTDNIIDNIPGSTVIGIESRNITYGLVKHIKNRLFHVQYEAALWKKEDILDLMMLLKKNNNKIVTTIHTVNTDFIKEAVKYCDHFILHKKEKLATDAIGKVPYTVITHPFPEYKQRTVKERNEMRDSMGFKPDDIVFGLNGFVLPYKHLAEQSSAIIQLIRGCPDCNYKLLLVCAPHEKDINNIGNKIMTSIEQYAETFGVQDKVVLLYKFMEKSSMAEHLNAMDFALCYHNNKSVGSQSGSVRELIASNVIPIVTKSDDLKMHDDLIDKSCAFGIKAKDGELGPSGFAKSACTLVHSLVKSNKHLPVIDKSHTSMRKYIEENGYSLASAKHMNIYNKIIGEQK